MLCSILKNGFDGESKLNFLAIDDLVVIIILCDAPLRSIGPTEILYGDNVLILKTKKTLLF